MGDEERSRRAIGGSNRLPDVAGLPFLTPIHEPDAWRVCCVAGREGRPGTRRRCGYRALQADLGVILQGLVTTTNGPAGCSCTDLVGLN
jgi:hypothetical protein